MKVLGIAILSLCFYCVAVFGSGSGSGSSDQLRNAESNPNPVELLEGFVKYFKAAEERNQEQAKVIEELKEQVKSTRETCQEQFTSLSKKFDEFKNEIRQDHGVWLLTPPLRGPPGKQGEKGDSGLIPSGGQPGERASSQPNSTSPSSKEVEAVSDPRSITSCSVAMEMLPSSRSTKQWIYPHGNATNDKVEVLCDFAVDGGGWTVVQKRTSGPRDQFKQTWNEYENGFGSLDKNFWLGLENIRALTKNGDQELRIELEDFEGEKKYAKYSSFSISDASDFYRLSVGGFDGNSTAKDSSMTSGLVNGTRFSTKDKDNDLNTNYNCAEYYGGGGGWWFGPVCNGVLSNLNGPYRQNGETFSNYNGIIWYSWKGASYSLAKTEMKIRRKKSV